MAAPRVPKFMGAMDEARSWYSAARRSRFRRVRTGTIAMGSGADYHYAIPTDYLRILEDSRDMDRNDAVIGAVVDRAVTNLIQDGMTVEPCTGDEGVNHELKARWEDWACDPEQCDIQGEHTFTEMEALAVRHMLVDGDIFGLFTQDGPLQMVEAHRPRTPSNTRKNCVHGVLLDDNRRRLEYWFTRDNVSPLAQIARVKDIVPYSVRSPDGFRQATQLYNPKRISQTRGVSVFAPIFDVAGMKEDIEFAALVKQQVSTCFTIFRSLDANAPMDGPPGQVGPQWSESQNDGTSRTIENISPGLQIRGKRGEKLEGFMPHVPGEGFLPHMRHLMQIIGLNLGLPLVVALMDASETNFSGWRGAMDQARMGWRRNQQCVVSRWNSPIYQWKVRSFIEDDPALERAAASGKIKLYKHVWQAPRWPYVNPKEDVATDLMRMRNGLSSPRRVQAERGDNWADVSTEICEDNALAICKAKTKAAEINKMFPEDPPVHWREVLSLPTPDGVNINLSGDTDTPPGKDSPNGQKPGSKRKGAA